MTVRQFQQTTVAIANGETESSAVVVADYAMGGFSLPDFTGTAMTFLVSDDGTNFYALKDSSGSDVTALTVAQNKSYQIPDDVFKHYAVKLKSGSAEGAARTISLLLKS